MEVIAARWTPGTVAAFSKTREKNDRCSAPSRYRASVGSSISSASRRSGTKPGSTCWSRQKLLIVNPAETSSTSAKRHLGHDQQAPDAAMPAWRSTRAFLE